MSDEKREIWDRAHGCMMPGRHGGAEHIGRPLRPKEINELPDGTQVVITWNGGNGPHPYTIQVGENGRRMIGDDLIVDTHRDRDYTPHRVTLGWTPKTRAYYDLPPTLTYHGMVELTLLDSGVYPSAIQLSMLPEMDLGELLEQSIFGPLEEDGDDFYIEKKDRKFKAHITVEWKPEP